MDRLKQCASIFWEVILAGFVAVLCVVVFLQVLLRYLIKVPFPASEEIVSISFIYTIFLGAAVGMKRGEHLAIDFLMKRVSPATHRVLLWVILTGTATFLFFVVVEGVLFVFDSYGQTTTYLRIPISYSYAAMPLSGTLMLYYLFKRAVPLYKGLDPTAKHERGS
jgi:TRAP-type C4-dicarboxylate transport system permease small subunit